MISIRLFVGVLFLLLQPVLGDVAAITIDREFVGWDGEIRSLLLALTRRAGYQLKSDAIQFRSVGKHAGCHHLALATFR